MVVAAVHHKCSIIQATLSAIDPGVTLLMHIHLVATGCTPHLHGPWLSTGCEHPGDAQTDEHL
jgi:hypothetical protein